MSKRTNLNQTWDTDGNLIAEETVEVIEYPSAEESATHAARLVVLLKLAADEIDDDDAPLFAGLFPSWTVGDTVKAGEVYRWDGTLVKVVQTHKTQADWTPDVVPALFKVHRAVGSVAAWVQPTGAHDAYALGERMTFKGATYESLFAANVYSPTVYPAAWKLI